MARPARTRNVCVAVLGWLGAGLGGCGSPAGDGADAAVHVETDAATPPDAVAPDSGAPDLAQSPPPAADAAVWSPPHIRGIYLVGSKAAVADGTLATAIAGPGIDGVLVKVRWADLSTGLRTYDWSIIDDQTRLAVDHGLKYEVAITLGGSAPDWLFAPAPAGLGAMKLGLRYAEKAGATGVCMDVNEARPWDPIFLDAVGDLLGQLAAHLKATGRYDHLTMMRLTAINGWTDELRLPAQTPRTITDLPCITDSVQIWSDAGYRPSVLLDGWNRALELYRKHFPDKTFNLAILAGGSLPPIKEDGTPAMGGTAPATVAQMVSDLVGAAARALPGKLVIQENGLVADDVPDAQVTTLAAANGAMFAWQSNQWLRQAGGAACGGSFSAPVECNVTTFRALMWNGIHPPGVTAPAQYLELFAPNTTIFPVQTRLAHEELVK